MDSLFEGDLKKLIVNLDKLTWTDSQISQIVYEVEKSVTHTTIRSSFYRAEVNGGGTGYFEARFYLIQPGETEEKFFNESGRCFLVYREEHAPEGFGHMGSLSKIQLKTIVSLKELLALK